jgi:S-sulfo-L-cysteine synthase (O-acetyl-L-serine-dependent)
MPEHMSAERRGAMASFGAEIVLTPKAGGMEAAIDLAQEMAAAGAGIVLDQFSNPDNPAAHYATTGPEIWRETSGRVTHFVSAMGTTGTIMGTGRYLREHNSAVQIIGVQPEEGAQIAGIRRWPAAYLPRIYDPTAVDRILDVSQSAAEQMTRALAAQEGIFAGVSSGGAVAAALRLSAEVRDAVIVMIICDRGDRYLSTGLFSQ